MTRDVYLNNTQEAIISYTFAVKKLLYQYFEMQFTTRVRPWTSSISER